MPEPISPGSTDDLIYGGRFRRERQKVGGRAIRVVWRDGKNSLRQVSPMVIRLVSVSDHMPLREFHDVFRIILGWNGDLTGIETGVRDQVA